MSPQMMQVMPRSAGLELALASAASAAASAACELEDCPPLFLQMALSQRQDCPAPDAMRAALSGQTGQLTGEHKIFWIHLQKQCLCDGVGEDSIPLDGVMFFKTAGRLGVGVEGDVGDHPFASIPGWPAGGALSQNLCSLKSSGFSHSFWSLVRGLSALSLESMRLLSACPHAARGSRSRLERRLRRYKGIRWFGDLGLRIPVSGASWNPLVNGERSP